MRSVALIAVLVLFCGCQGSDHLSSPMEPIVLLADFEADAATASIRWENVEGNAIIVALFEPLMPEGSAQKQLLNLDGSEDVEYVGFAVVRHAVSPEGSFNIALHSESILEYYGVEEVAVRVWVAESMTVRVHKDYSIKGSPAVDSLTIDSNNSLLEPTLVLSSAADVVDIGINIDQILQVDVPDRGYLKFSVPEVIFANNNFVIGSSK